jgi:hypothetical protein
VGSRTQLELYLEARLRQLVWLVVTVLILVFENFIFFVILNEFVLFVLGHRHVFIRLGF